MTGVMGAFVNGVRLDKASAGDKQNAESDRRQGAGLPG